MSKKTVFRQLQIASVAVALLGPLMFYIYAYVNLLYIRGDPWRVIVGLFTMPLLMLTYSYPGAFERGLSDFLLWYGFVAFVALILVQRGLDILGPRRRRKR